LCGTLQLPSAVYQQVLKALEYVLTIEVSVICNRHVDQVLMATLYGVCRVNHLSVTFKSIIEKYNIQPQSSAKIYRDVLLQDETKGDIITFYNNVYIPVMQQFLIQTQATSTPDSSINTNLISHPIKQKLVGHNIFSSPIRIPHSPHHNLYVSPMSTRVAPPHNTTSHSATFPQNNSLPSLLSNTPRSVLFSFGQSPAQDLRNINNSINSPMPHSLITSPSVPNVASYSRRAKRQLFDSDEDNNESAPQKKKVAEEEV